MALFSIAWDRGDRLECGSDKSEVWTNDKDDPGGETVHGISRKNHPNCSVWDLVDHMKECPGFPETLLRHQELKRRVQEFFRRRFWDPLDLDRVEDQELANHMYTCYMLMGRGTDNGTPDPNDDKGGIVFHIQNYLNLVNRDKVPGQKRWDDIKVDGAFGPITRNLFNRVLEDSMLREGFKKALSGEMYWWLKTYCLRNPKLEKYYLGWILNRI